MGTQPLRASKKPSWRRWYPRRRHYGARQVELMNGQKKTRNSTYYKVAASHERFLDDNLFLSTSRINVVATLKRSLRFAMQKKN
jgi:hypothetical protein